jgi:hypothetical protein
LLPYSGDILDKTASRVAVVTSMLWPKMSMSLTYTKGHLLMSSVRISTILG